MKLKLDMVINTEYSNINRAVLIVIIIIAILIIRSKITLYINAGDVINNILFNFSNIANGRKKLDNIHFVELSFI